MASSLKIKGTNANVISTRNSTQGGWKLNHAQNHDIE